jgi:RNA polymerase sigma-70 factor (ECF subfamily)
MQEADSSKGSHNRPDIPSGTPETSAEALAEHYSGALRLARSILRHDGEAADAVQTAYSNALRNLSRFREESSLGTWLSRIVVNQCLMRLRQLRRTPQISIDELPNAHFTPLFGASRLPGPHESFERHEIAKAIERALEQLPETLRQAWMLYEFEGLDLRTLSHRLGITIAAAKSRLFRARAELRETLAPVRAASSTNRKASPAHLVACLQ